MFWVLLIIFFVTYFLSRTVDSVPVQPVITNLRIVSGDGSPNQSIEWDETGAVRRTVTLTASSEGDTITNIVQGSATAILVNSYPIRTVRVTLYSLNDVFTAFADLNLSNPCFLGEVLIKTLVGPQQVKDLLIGSQLLQIDGSYSKIVDIKKSVISDVQSDNNHRIFADSDNKLMVTYWHKMRFLDEPEEIMAGEHLKLREIKKEFPFEVFNFVLDHYSHKILIHDSNIVAESFVPVNPS